MRVREGTRMEVERGEKVPHCWLWRRRRGPPAKEGRQPLEAGKVRESDFLLEPPERTSPVGLF